MMSNFLVNSSFPLSSLVSEIEANPTPLRPQITLEEAELKAKIALQAIFETVTDENFQRLPNSAKTLADKLNLLCGESGYAKLDLINKNFQIELHFESKLIYQVVMKAISEQLATFNYFEGMITCEFLDKQKVENETFELYLDSLQSVGLLGIKPIKYFKEAQKIFNKMYKFNYKLTLPNLKNEIMLNICKFLPLKSFFSLARVNVSMYKKLASQTDLSINFRKMMRKEQVKEGFRQEYKYFDFDLLRNKLIYKVEPWQIPSEISKEFFEKYVPEGYQLPYCVGNSPENLKDLEWGHFYRKEGKTCTVESLFVSVVVTTTYKQFRIELSNSMNSDAEKLKLISQMGGKVNL